MSKRLRRGQEDRMRAVVLAYVAKHGPLGCSEIWQPLAGRMSDTYVKLTLDSLVERGQGVVTQSVGLQSDSSPDRTATRPCTTLKAS